MSNHSPFKGRKPYLWLAGGMALGALLMAAIQTGKILPNAWAQRPAKLRNVAHIDTAGLDTLKSLDSAFSAVSEYALQSTVQIRSENSSSRGPSGRLTNLTRGEGSGVIYRSDGYIITNDHVVNGFEKVTVLLADGKEYKAKVLTAEDSDIAVLKIDATGLPALEFADSGAVKPGQYALALGSPFGLENTVTIGHISAIGRPSAVPDGRTSNGARFYPDMIQTDAAINMGNSGGPLVNVDGQVIGINTAIFSRTGDSVGIGFAIPANQARLIADTLISKGKITRGFLGLVPENLKEFQKKELGLTGGAIVGPYGDVPSSPAKDAGIKPGDVIVRIGSVNVRNQMDLRNAMLRYGPGETVDIEYVRAGKHETVKVKLGEPPKPVAQQAPQNSPFNGDSRNFNFEGMPKEFRDFQKQFGKLGDDNQDVAPLKSGPARLGVSVDATNKTLRQQYRIPDSVAGAVVTVVEPGSVADRLGIKPGDVITKLGDRTIKGAEDLVSAMKDVKWGDSRHLSFTRYGEGSMVQQSRDITFR